MINILTIKICSNKLLRLIRVFPQYVLYEFTGIDDKLIAVKRIRSKDLFNEGQFVSHYTVKPSVIAVIFELTIVYVSFELDLSPS